VDFYKFLTHQAPDFQGRTLEQIWSFDDLKIERTHDFIQILFPTNKKSQSVFHGLYLDNENLIQQLKENEKVKKNLTQSSEWFLAFLTRQNRWRQSHDHNQLRITRIIESLRLLVSNEAADSFRDEVLSLLGSDHQINPRTLRFWLSA